MTVSNVFSLPTLAAATAYALEQRRKRKDEEARQRAEAQREAARRNAAEEARKAQAYLLAQIAAQQAALEQTAAHRGEEAKIERMEEAEGAALAAARTARSQREQAYQDYRAGERAEYVSPPPACTVDNIKKPKSWWQRAGEWVQQKIVQPVQQAVPKVMNWVDQHQTEIAIGIGIAAGVTAVVLSGGAATPLVAAGRGLAHSTHFSISRSQVT